MTAALATGTAERRLPASAPIARAEIEERSQAIVSAILREPALHGQIAGSKAFIDQAAIDYAGRFLYELVQNAYDAHTPDTTDGRIHVLLDPAEGESGVLYVANTGVPFDNDDVRAICEIAQTSKRPGQGIGNKGVGFKSVLLVTDWPEIHSRGAERSPSFTGYAFGFATDDDVVRLAGGSETNAKIVLSCASRYTLPVPVNASGHVDAFASAGMASVIRLPLRGPEELVDARAQMEQLASPGAPVLLFLDRISELVIEDTGISQHHVMTRQEHTLRRDAEIDLRTVTLSEDGEYLLAHRNVALEPFLQAVKASVDRKRLDPSWLDWSDPARVSVAIRLRSQSADDRMYAFLPMGEEAHGPMPGHVNAPFAIRLARDLPIEDVPLNEFLLDEAAGLCAEIAAGLRDHLLSEPDSAVDAASPADGPMPAVARGGEG